MPDKPENHRSKKQAEDHSPKSPEPDSETDIDDIELEPIHSHVSGERSPENIPKKPRISAENDSTAEPVDHHISDYDADEEDDDGEEEPLLGSPDPDPAVPNAAGHKREIEISPSKTDDLRLDDDEEEFLIDDASLPDEDFEDAQTPAEKTGREDDLLVTPGQSPAGDTTPGTASDMDTQNATGNDPASQVSEGNQKKPKKKGSGTTMVEKVSLGFLLLLLIVGLAVYVPQMIPEAQLTNDIVDVADTPIEFEDITIENLEARWIETTDIKSEVRRGVEWTPEVEITISGSGSGALRFIFLNQDGLQRGDTMDLGYENGKFLPSNQATENIYCTSGFTSELGLKDLRARGDKWWTVRVLKGQDTKAPSSEFDTIVEMKIPFEIVVSGE